MRNLKKASPVTSTLFHGFLPLQSVSAFLFLEKQKIVSGREVGNREGKNTEEFYLKKEEGLISHFGKDGLLKSDPEESISILLSCFSSYLLIGDGANNPAKAPTAAEPKAINPSGMVAAVLMLK